MKRLYKLFGIIVIGVVIGLAVVGCDNPADGDGDDGCKGDGACYYIIANGDYKWCGDKNCSVWMSEDIGQVSLSCNCK